jgi:signal transduction histidine kinase
MASSSTECPGGRLDPISLDDERARLVEAVREARADAEAARRRLAFLDDVSALLAESGEDGEMLSGLARLAVPALGEWAGVLVTTEQATLRLAASSGDAALGAAAEVHVRADPGGRVAAALRGGEPVRIDGIPVPPGSRIAAALVAPLCLKRRSLGALVVAGDAPLACLSEVDRTLVADVAHRTALAVEHARLLREATLAAAAREEFLHVASHELRGPLGTLRLTVQLLTRDVGGSEPEAVVARLRILDRQAARLVRLSDALLDVSRITSGRIELAREPGDLAALVRDVASVYRDEAEDLGSPLEVAADGPVRCSFDAARMEQVISNLVSNAIKYGRGHPVRIAARLDGDHARVDVEDRGIGIAPTDLERIFGRFERAVSGRQYAGLGLGLWIVRRLVDAHGGTVRVRSALGQGSTFTVELPVS